MSLKHALLVPQVKWKGKLTDSHKPRLKNEVQTQIDLFMDKINKYFEMKTQNFDDLVEFKKVILAK